MIINNQFSFDLKPEWTDTTVFTFAGPVEDGIRHDIIITVENPVEIPDLDRYADQKVMELENTLSGYTRLKREDLFLNDGTPAHEIVFKWYPVENRRIYQRMVYIMGNGVAYTVTTCFSKKTWKMMGSMICDMINTFELQMPMKGEQHTDKTVTQSTRIQSRIREPIDETVIYTKKDLQQMEGEAPTRRYEGEKL